MHAGIVNHGHDGAMVGRMGITVIGRVVQEGITALEFWMADSRGHWEGDTLVVSVADFNNQTWFDRAGNFHSEEMRLVERYTPMGPNHISYEVTVEDPKVFTRPWSIQTVLYRRLEENVQTLDYECLEFEEPFLPWDEVPVPGMPGPPNR